MDGPPPFGARTDVGRVRTGNEDGYLARPPLFVVADGMGGHNAGEVASGLAVRLIDEALPAGVAPAPAAIASAIKVANAAVWSEARHRPDLAGMGTTCTIVVTDGAQAHVAHVGDSRAYLLRDGVLAQVTTDHTLIASMVREGLLTDEDAQSDERRHIITRAIGAEQDVRIDLSSHDLRRGDRLLLCSDGLSSQVDDAAIQRVLAGETDPSRAVDRLVELANEAGGEDNVTVIVVDPDRLVVHSGPDPRAPTTVVGAPATVIAAAPTVTEPSPESPAADPARAAEPSERSRGGARTMPLPDPVAAPHRPAPATTRPGGRWRAVAAVLALVLVALLVLAATGGLGGFPVPGSVATEDPRASRDVPQGSASPGETGVPGGIGSGTPPPPASLGPSSGVEQESPAP